MKFVDYLEHRFLKFEILPRSILEKYKIISHYSFFPYEVEMNTSRMQEKYISLQESFYFQDP
jgi:hypothetical protein